MTEKERRILTLILVIVAGFIAMDVATDLRAGTKSIHILLESLIGVGALVGVFVIYKEKILLQHQLESEVKHSHDIQVEADKWRNEAKKYIEGLALAIDKQLINWQLSPAEKEVAFLLLKGLSLKEIAGIRQTTEKTARIQSMAIYAKSGLSGRSELAAFFLEDLLLPQEMKNNALIEKQYN